MGKIRLFYAVILSTVTLALLGADDLPLIFNAAEYDSPWITGDTNGNGLIDYALKLDENGMKLYEAMDFNGDGVMDDFYFYRNEVLIRQELDTNFDGNIDLRIFMYDGVRVERYERDTNHDGNVDLVREFGGR